MHSKNLGAYLLQADGVNSLMQQAKCLLELRQLLLGALPEPLAKNATVANYRQGKLVIFAANAAVAAKLKLLRPVLTERFSARGLQVTVIEIEVQPCSATQTVPTKRAALSQNARLALAKLASELPESELKSAVASIARRDSGHR